jgi:hypothetical protein
LQTGHRLFLWQGNFKTNHIRFTLGEFVKPKNPKSQAPNYKQISPPSADQYPMTKTFTAVVRIAAHAFVHK